MNVSSNEFREINELIELTLDNSISPEQSQRLNDLIIQNPAVCRHYCEYIHLTVGIERLSVNNPTTDFQEYNATFDQELWNRLALEEKSAPAIEIPKEKPPRELIQKVIYPPQEKRKISKFSLYSAIFSAAAMLLFVLFLKVVPPKGYSVEVATLVDQMNAQWSQSHLALSNGSRLWTNEGPVSLKNGIVKIQYDTDVDVLIEGPARFEIERAGVYLEYGRLFSRVSESGLGFRVETPTCRFIDLGTEFGIKAAVDGSSELHVVKGKVQLFAGSKDSEKSGRIVHENKAVRFDAGGKIKEVVFAPERYITSVPSAYDRAVMDSRPIAYWRFANYGQPINEIDPKTHVAGYVGNVCSVDCSDLAASALQFDGQGGHVAIAVQKPYHISGWSYALWMRPTLQSADPESYGVLTGRGRYGYLRVSDKGALGHCFIRSGGDVFESQISDTVIESGRWHHVVVTVESRQGHSDSVKNIYVDGVKAAVHTTYPYEGYGVCDTIKIGAAVGKNMVSNKEWVTKAFAGDITQVALYDRSLTEDEVKALYSADRN